jgi:hypothetical protein
MAISDSGRYDLLVQVAEEFAARFHRGERPLHHGRTPKARGSDHHAREHGPGRV